MCLIVSVLTSRPRCVEISPFGSRCFTNTVIDRLQIELGSQVDHRQILVVELAVLLGRIAVAVDEML